MSQNSNILCRNFNYESFFYQFTTSMVHALWSTIRNRKIKISLRQRLNLRSVHFCEKKVTSFFSWIVSNERCYISQGWLPVVKVIHYGRNFGFFYVLCTPIQVNNVHQYKSTKRHKKAKLNIFGWNCRIWSSSVETSSLMSL